MTAASERRLNELPEPAAGRSPGKEVAGPGAARRGARVAIVAVVVVLECAWLAAVAYLVWRLVTLV